MKFNDKKTQEYLDNWVFLKSKYYDEREQFVCKINKKMLFTITGGSWIEPLIDGLRAFDWELCSKEEVIEKVGLPKQYKEMNKSEYNLTFFEAMEELKKGAYVGNACHSDYYYGLNEINAIKGMPDTESPERAYFGSNELNCMWKVVKPAPKIGSISDFEDYDIVEGVSEKVKGDIHMILEY